MASDQVQQAHDPAAGSAVFSGLSREWGSCCADRLYADCNRLRPGKSFLLEMKAATSVAFNSVDLPLAERTWERQGGPRPQWKRLFMALANMAMVGWVREAAWSMLRGSVSWGTDRLSFAPEQALCPFCMKHHSAPTIETANHFAECPRFDGLWHEAQCMMVAAGMPIVVRRWFVLYGPESAYFSRVKYDVVVWIWAAFCAVSLSARRQYWANAWQQVWSRQQIIETFRTLLRQAAAAELAAVTTWTMPDSLSGGRFGRRQVRTKRAWQQRWQGLALLSLAGMVFYGDSDFDKLYGQRLVEQSAPRRQPWRRKRKSRYRYG
eukprot:SAG31_NODE_53_length_30139_cov_31.002197_3_plen_321_part_00